jgi:hypothetical protein
MAENRSTAAVATPKKPTPKDKSRNAKTELRHLHRKTAVPNCLCTTCQGLRFWEAMCPIVADPKRLRAVIELLQRAERRQKYERRNDWKAGRAIVRS